MLERIKNSDFVKDVTERVVFTFLQAFLAVYIVGGDGSMESAAIAGTAAVLSLVKGWLATRVGDPSSAAMIRTDSAKYDV